VLAAARAAQGRVRLLAAFDTLEYLRRGGRIGAASAFLGSLIAINPLIELRDGVVQPAGRTRSRRKAVEQLISFVSGYSRIDGLAVENSACQEEADELADRLGALHPKERILRTRMTPAIGAHTGPGLLVVAVLGDRR
jgi:DegV family protein with EDD domain